MKLVLVLYLLHFLYCFQGIQNVHQLHDENLDYILESQNYFLIFCEDLIEIRRYHQIRDLVLKLQILYQERDLGLGRMNCTSSISLAARIQVSQRKKIILYRFGDMQEYSGQLRETEILNWIVQNKRQLIHVAEEQDDLFMMISKKPSLVYFSKEYEFIDPFIIEKMEDIAKKYSEIQLVLAKSPLIRKSLLMDDDSSLILYQNSENSQKIQGFLENLEYFLFEKLLTQIYKGTQLELEYTLKNNFAFFVLFEEQNDSNEEFQQLAQFHSLYVKFFFLNSNNIEFCQTLRKLFKQQLNYEEVYFYNPKDKSVLKTKQTEIKYLIWDYIDKNDGIRFDI